jgi:hypothetical protein
VRKFRILLLALGLLAIPLAVTPAMAAVHKADVSAAAPSAAQILARANRGCTKVSKANFKTDEDASKSNISICKAGKAFVWKADMDIDCDGVRTKNCNENTDDAYQNQTSFETSKGKSFQADKTHYFVIPLPSNRFNYQASGIKPGSVAAIIFKNKVVYAVFADEGPKEIIGEASFATAGALGIPNDPNNGGVDSGVTYVVFPGQVPSPVEDNSKIDAKGVAAATAFINS